MRDCHIAVDIGGSSVKVVAARLKGRKIERLHEQTVQNAPLCLPGGIYIDIYRLYRTVLSSVGGICAQGFSPATMGIDTYGNGYAVYDRDMSMAGLPRFYKDPFTKGILDQLSERIPLFSLYSETGVYPTEIRVLMQLFYEVLHHTARIENARRILLLPDILGYLLTGEQAAEKSMACVANLLSCRRDDWCRNVLCKLSIPENLFPPLVEGGQDVRRPVLREVRKETGCGDMQLVQVTAHDTESALLAAPGLRQGMLFISLGTSVIIGTITPAPLISQEGFDAGFKNMYGAFGGNSLCRDFSGLWLLEQCIEEFSEGRSRVPYGELIAACQAAPPNTAYLNVCDPCFRFRAGTLLEAIRAYCQKTRQQPPAGTIGSIAKCLLESLVLEMLWSYHRIIALTGNTAFAGVSVVGGGVHNGYLLKSIADALQLPLYAGSSYAASTGNILMQLYVGGELSGYEDIKEVAANSCGLQEIFPAGDGDRWMDGLSRLQIYKSIQ